MPHQPYPAFSLECATELFRIVREGAIATEVKAFAKCAYTLIGAGLGIYPGEPDDVEPLFTGGEECDVETAEKCRQELLAIADVGLPPGSFGDAGEEPANLDPATIMLLIQLAKMAIEAWLKRKRA